MSGGILFLDNPFGDCYYISVCRLKRFKCFSGKGFMNRKNRRISEKAEKSILFLSGGKEGVRNVRDHCYRRKAVQGFRR